MSILFIDQPEARQRLLPLTYTRPIADLRVGILTIAEKWKGHLAISGSGFVTEGYLQKKFQTLTPTEDTIWIINSALPTPKVKEKVIALKSGEALCQGDVLIAARGIKDPLDSEYLKVEFSGHPVDYLTYTWDIFRLNGKEIRNDYQLLTKNRKSVEVKDPHTVTYGEDIFLEEGAVLKAAILNAENGPIYLGKNANVREGAIIRGPFAMGEGSIVAMGAKVRGDSTVGPYCKIGGEVSNSVIWGYSNKGHDGFLGNAVIGQWCNLGADTNNSNLKNDYDPIRMWDYETQSFIQTGLRFCGLIMGDHSKCGINTMFNTGTTVGVAANIFGEGFPETIIPSFAWGGASGFVTHHIRKALITAKIVMERRNLELTEDDKHVLNHIFEVSAPLRIWEKE